MRIALTSLPFAFSIHDSRAGTLALLRHRSPVFSHVDPSGQTFIKLKTRYNPTRNCALSVFSAETADMFYLHSSQLVIYPVAENSRVSELGIWNAAGHGDALVLLLLH